MSAKPFPKKYALTESRAYKLCGDDGLNGIQLADSMIESLQSCIEYDKIEYT